MKKLETGRNAGKVWTLLSDNAKWDYETLKQKSGLSDIELGAALGWLAREDKIEFYEEECKDTNVFSVCLGVNVYIG